MQTLTKQASPTKQKRKRKSGLTIPTTDPKLKKLEKSETIPITTHMTPISPAKPPKSAGTKPPKSAGTKPPKSAGTKLKAEPKVVDFEVTDKYPLLKNQDLISQFLKVQMTNNQKGRIRQAVKESLQGTSNVLEPEIIHNKIQSIVTNSSQLTDAELRRIRILYNLLKTALKQQKLTASQDKEAVKPKKHKKKKIVDGESPEWQKKVDGESPERKEKVVKEKKDMVEQKVRGPKRYIVFLGNLPLGVDKDKIKDHFKEMNEQIVDVRIPKAMEGKKSAIAYLELSNEPSYEFALSKHHSMLGKKRINVLYTAPPKGKVTKDQAKSKSAKLIALQKSGKLVGSVPLAKKRSQRRLKMKKAQAAKLAAENA